MSNETFVVKFLTVNLNPLIHGHSSIRAVLQIFFLSIGKVQNFNSAILLDLDFFFKLYKTLYLSLSLDNFFHNKK
jgi:hypothetical protein